MSADVQLKVVRRPVLLQPTSRPVLFRQSAARGNRGKSSFSGLQWSWIGSPPAGGPKPQGLMCYLPIVKTVPISAALSRGRFRQAPTSDWDMTLWADNVQIGQFHVEGNENDGIFVFTVTELVDGQIFEAYSATNTPDPTAAHLGINITGETT